MPKFDKLGDKCKWEEKTFCNNSYLISQIPCFLRVDGRNFHNFTKGLTKPFDPHLADLMIETTKYLVSEVGAVWGFTQSDEITLCLLSDSEDSQIFFDGKIQKIVSVVASITTAFFNDNKKHLPLRHQKTLAMFDCRAFNVPTIKDAVRQYIWRENDATRNSLSMLAQANFPHSALHGKKRPELHDLLKSKNINWNDLPSKYKRGTIVRRVKRGKQYSEEEINSFPANHEARRNPNMIVERTSVEVVEFPPLGGVSNKADVLFKGETPILISERSKAHD